jgi:hypothetical protein
MKQYLTFGFVLAGLINIFGVLGFSLGFQNELLASYYPQIFSHFGLGMIILWGMAYISVSTEHPRASRLIFVFFIEKMVYVGTAVYFWFVMKPDIMLMWNESVLTTIFMVVYGINDLLFGLMFLYAWLQYKK